MQDFKQTLADTSGCFDVAGTTMAVATAQLERDATVLESLAAAPHPAEMILAGRMAAVDTMFAEESLESFSLTGDTECLQAACEGILESIADKVKAGVNRITGALLKPLNAMMKVGDALDKIAGAAVNAPLKAVTGKEVNTKGCGMLISGLAAAGAIGVLWYSGAPKVILNVLEKAKAGQSTGAFSTETTEILSKITNFKWPFGDFSATKAFSTGKISIKYRMFADKVGVLRAEGGAGVFSKEALNTLVGFAKEASAEILKIAKAMIIGIPKAFAQAAAEVGKFASANTGIGATLRAAPETTIARLNNPWGARAMTAFGAATLAIITGFVGKVVITGSRALVKAIHSVTGTKSEA